MSEQVKWWHDFKSDREWFNYCEKYLQENKERIKDYIEHLKLHSEDKIGVNGPHKFYCLLLGGFSHFKNTYNQIMLSKEAKRGRKIENMQ